MSDSPAAKPFLLLSTRAEDAAAHAEQLSFARAAGLAPAMLHQIRLERERPRALDMSRYAGVIVGGGPYNASDESKSAVQLEVEAWFSDHLAVVLETDSPFFGACYGVVLLGTVVRGRVSRKHGEEAAVVEISVTADGADDPVLAGLPERFHAMVADARRPSRSCPPGRRCRPPAPRARCRCSGWAPTPTPRSSIRSSTPTRSSSACAFAPIRSTTSRAEAHARSRMRGVSTSPVRPGC